MDYQSSKTAERRTDRRRVIRFPAADGDELAAELGIHRPTVIAAEQIQIAWKCHQETTGKGLQP